MPVASFNDGVEECYGILIAACDDAAGIVGSVPEIRWPGVQNPAPEPQDLYWIRPSFQTVESAQSALQSVKKRYTTVGLFLMTIYCPKSNNDPLGVGRRLGSLIIESFKVQTPSGIWFRRQKQKELPENDNNYPILVSITTEWLEISS